MALRITLATILAIHFALFPILISFGIWYYIGYIAVGAAIGFWRTDDLDDSRETATILLKFMATWPTALLVIILHKLIRKKNVTVP